MDDEELRKRLDQIDTQLDELTVLVKKSAEEVEATYKFVAEFNAQFDFDVAPTPKLDFSVGDRVGMSGALGTVVAVGVGTVGPMAMVAWDGYPQPRQEPMIALTKISDDSSK